MYRKILVAIDGSEQSYKCADFAYELAEKMNSEVLFLEVVPAIPVYGGHEKSFQRDIQERDTQMIKEANEHIAKAAKKFKEANIPFESQVLIGNPADNICETAEKKDVSLIIIGTRGMTGVSRFMMGSVSSKVVTYAPCSVLVTR